MISILRSTLALCTLSVTALLPQNAVAQTLDYSTFLGGSKSDGGRVYVAIDGVSVIVAASTSSANFPTTLPSTPPSGSSNQISLTKLTPDGNGSADLVWSLLLGGSGNERVRGLGVDASGQIYLSGTTTSTDFFTDDGTSGPGIFVVALTAGGSVDYATVLGTDDDPEDGGLAVDAAGNAYVTGSTSSVSFPDTLGTTYGGGQSDAVVTKLDASGSTLYSRFLGGSGEEGGRGIALDSAGNAYVIGKTSSTDFPVTAGVFQNQLQGPNDAFVVRLDAAGAIAAGTYMGGGDEEMGREGGIDVGPLATVWTTGRTQSSNFPAVNAFDASANGGTEGFVAQLSGDLSALLYSTYLGGSSGERGTCILTDDDGLAYVAGRTLSGNFPTTTNAFDQSLAGRHEGFFAVVDSTQSGSNTLTLSSFLGGNRDDGTVCLDLGTDGGGNVRAYMVGPTASKNDFPLTAGAYDSSYNGGQSDIFVSVFDFVSTPDPVCGNNVAEGGEICDGTDLGGQTCDDLLGCIGGVLLCNASCDAFDTTLCTGPNLVREGSEECDGSDFGTTTCADFDCGGGVLSCNADCTIDPSTCVSCCTEVGESCRKDSDCCSQNCSNGPPASRVCQP